MLKIAVLDDFQDAARRHGPWSRLTNADVQVFTDNVTGDLLLQRLLPFDVVVAIRERTPFRAPLLAALPKLRMIATTGMRNLGIDVAECRRRGITVSGTEAVGAPAAELSFALIIALARNLVAEDRSLRAGTWETRHIGSTLQGRTLGLLGLGKLGTEVAAMGRAFGMDPIAWSPNLTPERAAAGGARLVDKAALFATADYLSIHLVLSDRSRGIVGAAEIAAMQPTACLVNTSRAGLVDEAALIAALHAGKLRGAGLDVFEQEPLPLDAPILAAPNTVLTPHLGYATAENYAVYFPQVVEAIEAWAAGTPIRVLTHD